MRGEWNALKTLTVSGIFGMLLVILMLVSEGTNQKEYLRDAKLVDGSEADWRDKTASVLYSPGELHAAHFKSEINCQHCHTPGKKVDSEYCISCHSGEDFRINSKKEVLRDTHLTVTEEMSCFACHSEHRGLGGKISPVLDFKGHKTLIDKEIREDCQPCHASDQKQSHPNMNNDTCVDCHKLEEPFAFKTQTFRHTDVKELKIDENSIDFIKLPFPDQGQCEDCHEPQFHVGEKGINLAYPSSVSGEFDCLSCHTFK